MEKSYNWGILGPGNISHRFSEGLKLLDNAVLHAIGSRDIGRAREFADLHGFNRYYGNYKELVADSDLDIVYIASPHSHHMEHTLLCLEAGKSVLCEKAFAINSGEVMKMIDLARRKGLFLMEALWPPFQPSYLKCRELLLGSGLGEIVSLRSFFAFKPPYEPEKRVYNLKLGGGALLDIGIYPVIDALTFLGVPDSIQTLATFDSSGADNNIDILFAYKDGRSASLFASLKSDTGVGCDLICERGIVAVRRLPDGSQETSLRKLGEKDEVYRFSPPSRGFHLEAREVMEMLDQGKTESSVVPLSFSIDLINVLDRIREKAGIIYPDRD